MMTGCVGEVLGLRSSSSSRIYYALSERETAVNQSETFNYRLDINEGEKIYIYIYIYKKKVIYTYNM